MSTAKKRMANEAERKAAARWVELYRTRKLLPIDLGPDGRKIFRAVTGDDLALVLAAFVENGTFVSRPEETIFRPSINLDFESWRKEGDSYDVAVEKVAAKHGCSSATVRANLVPRNRVRLRDRCPSELPEPVAETKRLDWIIGAVEIEDLRPHRAKWEATYGDAWRDLLVLGIRSRLGGVPAATAVENALRLYELRREVVIALWAEAGLLVVNAPVYKPPAHPT